MNFEEFANRWMKEFFLEIPSRENCDKMGKLVWAYLWDHPEFVNYKGDVEFFWSKVGDAWESIEDSYNTAGKL